MKRILSIALTIFTLTAYGQDKNNYVHYNKLTEVAGTDYVMASIENWNKIFEAKGKHLLFINTKTGEANKVEFPIDAGIGKIEQIKLDSLGINLIVVSARTYDLDGKNGISWGDPTQIILLSPDGKEKIQLTENKFFVSTWAVNKLTGSIVIAGYYDSNNNNKYDKTDQDELLIYDLKTRKLISRI